MPITQHSSFARPLSRADVLVYDFFCISMRGICGPDVRRPTTCMGRVGRSCAPFRTLACFRGPWAATTQPHTPVVSASHSLDKDQIMNGSPGAYDDVAGTGVVTRDSIFNGFSSMERAYIRTNVSDEANPILIIIRRINTGYAALRPAAVCYCKL